MKLNDVVLLAGDTSRSRTYAQAMIHSNLQPKKILIFGPEKNQLLGQIKEIESYDAIDGLFLPDISESLIQICSRQSWNIESLTIEHVNDAPIYECLFALKPKLVIYSGYGSQIVGTHLLNLEIPFLHMHAGWLPDYRGSTTLYYSLLRENSCAVSALFLNEKIDEGAIIDRKRYPPPPLGMDPDHIYDGAIRADLLITVLQDYVRDGYLKTFEQSAEGVSYYVIHPVLKHLARLRNKPCSV